MESSHLHVSGLTMFAVPLIVANTFVILYELAFG